MGKVERPTNPSVEDGKKSGALVIKSNKHAMLNLEIVE